MEVQEACISSGKSVLPHLSLGVHTSLQEAGPFVSPPITPQMQHEKNGRDQLQVKYCCDGACMRDCVCSITEWYPTLLSRSLKLLFQPLLCLVLPLGILSLKKQTTAAFAFVLWHLGSEKQQTTSGTGSLQSTCLSCYIDGLYFTSLLYNVNLAKQCSTFKATLPTI